MYWTQLFLQLHVHVWKCITFNNTTLYIYNFTTPPYIHNFTTPPQQSIEITFRCCNSQQPIVLLQCLLLPDGWWTPFKWLQLTCSPFIKLCCSVKMVHLLCVYVFHTGHLCSVLFIHTGCHFAPRQLCIKTCFGFTAST